MNSVNELHDLAMGLTDYAAMARRYGDLQVARELLARALYYESQAASALVDRSDAEPSRSVLHRSAAALALKCGEYEKAERLITVGLAGKPPGDIASELRDLLKEVRKQKGGTKDALLPPTRQRSP